MVSNFFETYKVHAGDMLFVCDKIYVLLMTDKSSVKPCYIVTLIITPTESEQLVDLSTASSIP